MTRPPADAPVTEPDAAIATALAHANTPALVASIVHLTGDASILDGPIRLQPATMGVLDGGLSPADEATVRGWALDALRAYRDRGCTLPDTAAARDHPPHAELRGRRGGARRVRADDVRGAGARRWRPPPSRLGRCPAGGATGLPGARHRRRHVRPAGGDEARGGGHPVRRRREERRRRRHWLENTYPGCRVDVANHFYSYSFEPAHEWSEHFSRQPELRAYFERCADRHGVRDRIRVRTEVIAARFDEARAEWQVRVRARDGGEETLAARAVISAVGQLNRPKLPEIPGLDSFAGPAFHSAAWPPDVALEGKRVAVVGTGASAFQLVPEVAARAARLSVFQRQPPWMVPNPRYHSRVSPEKKWLLRHVPYYARWHRFVIFWPGSDGLLPSLEIDPDWPHPERSVNPLNDMMRVYFTDWISRQVGDRPDLLAKVVPTYPPFGKRMLQDNGSWLAALTRDNVELVTEPIAAIGPAGIRCASGREIAADVIVFATGFHANRFLWPMDLRGRGGASLRERWGDDPRAYLGITVPGFPNFFCLYGPGTNLAHGGSIIFHSECQVRYVMGCLHALLARRLRTLECRPGVHDEYNRRLDARLARLVWSHPGMTSWYKNAAGRVTSLSPWRLVDYWRWTRAPALEDFELR